MKNQDVVLPTCSQIERFPQWHQDGNAHFIEIYSTPVREVFKLLLISAPNDADQMTEVMHGDLPTLNELAEKRYYEMERAGFIAPRSTYCGMPIN